MRISIYIFRVNPKRRRWLPRSILFESVPQLGLMVNLSAFGFTRTGLDPSPTSSCCSLLGITLTPNPSPEP